MWFVVPVMNKGGQISEGTYLHFSFFFKTFGVNNYDVEQTGTSLNNFAKGQLILKVFLVSSISSKKRMNEFNFITKSDFF